MTVVNSIQTTDHQILEATFNKMLIKQYDVAQSSAKMRIAKLKRLQRCILAYKEDIREALLKDFKKHPSEVDLTEIYPITGAIKHAVSNLRSWMSPQRVGTPLALMGTSSWIHYEPKGIVLIISPWNFPVNLTFGPLVSAIAAGNCVILKPSEHTPYTSAVMKKIVEECFDHDEVALYEGGVETSKSLLNLPFNHIFFTGSPQVGKIVMAAAAKNLASVTLELGGKSPTIVDETADLDIAATRIAWSKCLNCGQICIAPDYVFVHEKVKDDFVKKMDEKIRKLYGGDVHKSDSYCRIVNHNHFERLKSYIDNAFENNADFIRGGDMNSDEDYIEPTLVSGVSEDLELMTNEIFGPILPVFVYKDLDEVIREIRRREKPLALYIYSRNRTSVRKLIDETRAGGTCINHSAIHFFNNNLPFGGVNNSGIGKAHGEFGFRSFSNARGVMKQWSPWSAIELMIPPYNNFKQKLIDLSIKYF